MLHENGLSISYDRVLEISADLGDAVVSRFIEDGVVCPHELQKGLFTTSAMDNIDHNPSSSTSTTSFHGTTISLFQHPKHDNEGEEREKLELKGNTGKRIPELPDIYVNIKPAHFINKNPSPPQVKDIVLPDLDIFRAQISLEYEWLQKVSITEEIESVNLTWSSHHADKKRGPAFEACILALMPLL